MCCVSVLSFFVVYIHRVTCSWAVLAMYVTHRATDVWWLLELPAARCTPYFGATLCCCVDVFNYLQ